ncbi:MAG: sugar phosphate isomerase/epimerase family protein [Anaerolineae bacterium]
MKFGVNTWVWTAPLTIPDLKTLAPHIKESGFDWIELPVESVDDYDPVEAGAIIRDCGLSAGVCAAMGPDRDLIHEDKAIQENGVAYLRQCLDIAKAVGATNLVGPLYSAVGRTWQSTADERARDMDLLISHLRPLSDYAADCGVTLGVEPLNRFETSFINLAAQVVELVDRVDRPTCRIMLDTFHMNIEERSVGQAIRLAGQRMCQLHSCENDRGAPGSGHVPWDEVAQALKDINYDGPIVIESFTPKVKSIARAAAIWRPLADSPDALASEGLAFLRKLLA